MAAMYIYLYIPVTVCPHNQASVTRNMWFCVSECTGLHLQMCYGGVCMCVCV